MNSQEPVLRERDWTIAERTRAEQDQIDHARDQTIAERIEQIEQALKRDPYVPYRRELEREYYALITDPEEPKNV